MHRKRLFGSVARILRVLHSFGRGPGVAGRPGGAGLWSRWPAGSPRDAPKGRPRRLFGTPLWAARGAPTRHRAVASNCFGSSLVSLGVSWGVSRVVRVTVGLRGPSGLLLGLLRLPGFRGRSPRRHPKTAKGKSGPCCLFCSCLSLGLSLGLPGRVSVHLALCRSVALCRFLPLCPACSQNFPY